MNITQRLGLSLGNAFEYYDIAVLASISGYLSIYLEKHGISHANETVWGIFALRFLIRPMGGVVIGYYANIFGRKSALILTSLITGCATTLLALMPESLSGKALLIFFFSVQVAQAFAFGGEYPALITSLLNNAKRDQRARISSLIVGSSIAGVIFSTFIVLSLKSVTNEEWMASTGWRIPVFLGVLNIIISFWFRCRLPVTYLRVMKQPSRIKGLKTGFNIFLCTIPGAVVFYIINIAGGITSRALHLGSIASLWPSLTSGILLAAIMFSGTLIDKKSTPVRAFKMSLMALFIFGVPLYLMLGTTNILFIFIAQILIIVLSGMLLSCLAAVLYELANGRNVALGIGYNISLSIFGGLTPLIVVQLAPYGMATAGIYMMLSTLPALIILHRKKESLS